MKEKIVLITQARLGSKRFPEKILKKIGKEELLSIHLKRLLCTKKVNSIVVATTYEKGVEKIIDISKKNNVLFYQGSTQDVLSRFYYAALLEKADYVVRVTSDCPLLDPKLVDNVVQFTIENNLDYCSNSTLIQNYPDGQDVEVFKFYALKLAYENANSDFEREHVTPYIINNSNFKGGLKFKSAEYPLKKNYENIRMTIDEKSDFDALKILINHLGTKTDWKTYTKFIINNPSLFTNQNIIRNVGSKI